MTSSFIRHFVINQHFKWICIITVFQIFQFKHVVSLYYRYIREWAEYKKTDAYKEFRRQQMEQKDAGGATKKVKHNSNQDTTSNQSIYFSFINLLKL